MTWLLAPFRPLIREIKLAWWHWAAHDMGPLHPNFPEAIHAIRNLTAERSQ
jgi:hypothetical protein